MTDLFHLTEDQLAIQDMARRFTADRITPFAAEWDETIIHGDLEKPAFLVYYIKNGKVVAAAGLDRDQDTAALIELFSLRRDWTVADLGDNPAALLARIRV